MKYKTQKGATLIETVTYVTIFALLSVMLVNTLALSATSFRELRATRNITTGSMLAMDRIVREIRLATGVSAVLSTLDVSPGKLYLTTRDANGLATTIEFSLASSTLRIKEGLLSYDLTPSHLVVDSLIFRHTASSSRDTVKIEMVVHDDRERVAQSHAFYATAVARGTY